MKRSSEEKETRILNSFDGIQPAELPPYFYTRLMARMQNEITDKKEPFFLLRPAFLTLSLSLLLIINIIFLTQFDTSHKTKQINKEATIESFSEAYDLNTTSVYQ